MREGTSRSARVRRTAATLVALVCLGLLAGPHVAQANPSPVGANEDVGLNPWWFDALNIAKAHEQTRGEGVSVAVIDSSINLEAADLQGADITLGPGRGPDGRSISYPDAFYASHGTSVTTVIAGQGTGSGGPGVVGVAPDAEVLFYQMDDDPYDGVFQATAEYIDQAVRDGADIINLSFEDSDRIAYAGAVERALDAGVVIVAGAGKKDRPGIGTPASIPGVVAVGAIDRDAQAWTGQPGQEEGALTISAPGVDMPIGRMEGPVRAARWISGLDELGTSFAAPIVSGMLALVKSKYPEATGNQLIQHLIHFVFGAEDDSTWGWRRDIGFGSASVTNMLAHDPNGWPDENPLLLDTVDDVEATYPFTIYGQIDDDTATDDPSPAASDTAAADSDGTGSDGTGMPVVAIIGGLLALVAIAAVTVLTVRRRRTLSPAESSGS